MILLSGNANKLLAEKIASALNRSLGQASVSTFQDGESRIEILEPLQAQAVFIIQPTSPPTNHHFMELCLMINAARRAFAQSITAVIPYFGYARQAPFGFKICVDLLKAAGADHLLTVDLHAELPQGFFSIPITNLSSQPVFMEDFFKKNYSNPIIISPDLGGQKRAKAFAKALNNLDFAVIDKERLNPSEIKAMRLIGNVKDRDCIIVDDLIDTAHTVFLAAKILKENGAKKVIAYVTHPVLSGNALKKIESSCLNELILTDTIPLLLKQCPRIRIVSIAPLLASHFQV